MMLFPEILQGTDGIRGRISIETNFDALSPLEFFLRDGILTPPFFERYTYAYASLLLRTKVAKRSDFVVVGWDPRDREGLFVNAAVDGIRKAGLNVVTTGILPTPAIPLYMLSINAVGSVVLTASHNPSDQNGIKLFHGFSALKFLPSDDCRLTATIVEQHRLDLSRLKKSGTLSDHSEMAKDRFIAFCVDPANSWISTTDFSDTILVIDASKGAVAEVVQPIFSAFTFKEIIYTNMYGDINEACGVADIEGREIVSSDQILRPGSPFYSYETLRTMVELGTTSEDIQRGKHRLVGLVFDGDGDRCYRLDFCPTMNELLVSSGDYLGIHQAIYLRTKELFEKDKSWFVNTVESDLNTTIFLRENGYVPKLTGVGDKWILLKAVTDAIHTVASSNATGGEEVLDYLARSDKKADISGFEISTYWRETFSSLSEKGKRAPFNFLIGIEESGHCVTPGALRTSFGRVRCFAGNGIKSGLNSLVAVKENFLAAERENWFDALRSPFPAGVSETLYVYYVEKSRLVPGTPFREKLERYLINQFKEVFPNEFTPIIVPFAEETSMLYCDIQHLNKTVGAIFIRNSGTEDKSALYLRGESGISSHLIKTGDLLHSYLLTGLKNLSSEFSQLETALLSAIRLKLSVETVTSEFPTLPIPRVLKEIEFKERLIKRQGDTLSLTEKGKRYLKSRTTI